MRKDKVADAGVCKICFVIFCSLLIQVMERLDDEIQDDMERMQSAIRDLLVQTLRLLEVSHNGLLEAEILELLYDVDRSTRQTVPTSGFNN